MYLKTKGKSAEDDEKKRIALMEYFNTDDTFYDYRKEEWTDWNQEINWRTDYIARHKSKENQNAMRTKAEKTKRTPKEKYNQRGWTKKYGTNDILRLQQKNLLMEEEVDHNASIENEILPTMLGKLFCTDNTFVSKLMKPEKDDDGSKQFKQISLHGQILAELKIPLPTKKDDTSTLLSLAKKLQIGHLLTGDRECTKKSLPLILDHVRRGCLLDHTSMTLIKTLYDNVYAKMQFEDEESETLCGKILHHQISAYH